MAQCAIQMPWCNIVAISHVPNSHIFICSTLQNYLNVKNLKISLIPSEKESLLLEEPRKVHGERIHWIHWTCQLLDVTHKNGGADSAMLRVLYKVGASTRNSIRPARLGEAHEHGCIWTRLCIDKAVC